MNRNSTYHIVRMRQDQIQRVIEQNVSQSIDEDVGEGDVNASLIPPENQSLAVLMTRSAGVFCGKPWADETAEQIGGFTIDWQINEGDTVQPSQELAQLRGQSRSILSAERVMINFLQLLSGTATLTKAYCDRISHTKTQLLDTRKTLPGLRIAQKYAVSVGGGKNHRMGLFDAFLIKENHIAAAGSIHDAVREARNEHPELPLEVEVETLDQLSECVAIGVPRALLDNFSLDETRKAVNNFGDRIELEASGGVTLENIREIAETGVDYVSVGAITKNVIALDLSLRFTGTSVQ
ncbi:MAG: carboxylating nicotinate-nucleotide diphosphorylase [Gammaproteobacteria bacterium]|nr:carboxylating nicotinate-nucleotide diphosphorylase [Gammaproteobacteria bacterium]